MIELRAERFCMQNECIQDPTFRRSEAFTLVELIVVLGVIGVVMALLLSAVQTVRGTARQASCQNNLRQVGLALQEYHAAFSCFPANFYGFVGTKFVNDHSALARISPYLGGDLSFIEFQHRGFARQRSRELEAAWLPTFACPSEPRTEETQYGSNYLFNRGLSLDAFGPTDKRGTFDVGATVSGAEIVDGLSHTAAVAERIIGSPHQGRYPGNVAVAPRSLAEELGDDGVRWRELCLKNEVTFEGFDSEIGRRWNSGGELFYSHFLTPNNKSLDCGNTSAFFPRSSVVTARSYHAGVVQVCMMDGSVQSIRESIDTPIWWSFGTRAGGDN